jgi:hypothetical protein
MGRYNVKIYHSGLEKGCMKTKTVGTVAVEEKSAHADSHHKNVIHVNFFKTKFSFSKDIKLTIKRHFLVDQLCIVSVY